MDPNEDTPATATDVTPEPKANTNGRGEDDASSESGPAGRHLSVPTVEQVKTTVNKAVDAAPPQVKGAVNQINTTTQKALEQAKPYTQKALEQAKPYQKHITVTLSGSAVLLLLVIILRRRGSASGS